MGVRIVAVSSTSLRVKYIGYQGVLSSSLTSR